MDAKKELSEKLRELREEYQYISPEIMDTDDINIRKIKWVIQTKLDIVDQTIFLLYTECGSLRKLGEMLNCSHSTIRPEVNRIKGQIKQELNNIKNVINI